MKRYLLLGMLLGMLSSFGGYQTYQGIKDIKYKMEQADKYRNKYEQLHRDIDFVTPLYKYGLGWVQSDSIRVDTLVVDISQVADSLKLSEQTIYYGSRVVILDKTP